MSPVGDEMREEPCQPATRPKRATDANVAGEKEGKEREQPPGSGDGISPPCLRLTSRTNVSAS
jgi:hypothetical protein